MHVIEMLIHTVHTRHTNVLCIALDGSLPKSRQSDPMSINYHQHVSLSLQNFLLFEFLY